MNKQLHFTPQASEFLTEQSAAVQKAFFEKLKKLSDDGLLREPDAKKIAPNLFEIRVKVTRMQYRLFYCYVDPNGIWVLSGFVKKTQRTPPNEIRKAQTIRKEVE
jgi:phage-related protein